MAPVLRTLLSGSVLVAATACSPGLAAPNVGSSAPRPAAVASPSASPAPSGSPVTLGDVTYKDYGLDDVSNRNRRGVDAGDFYFEATFLRGRPGQQLGLKLRNQGQVAHNFSLDAQQIDVDLPVGGGMIEVPVVFPESGALRFYCKLHAAQGMNGQLLVGDAQPQAISFVLPTSE